MENKLNGLFPTSSEANRKLLPVSRGKKGCSNFPQRQIKKLLPVSRGKKGCSNFPQRQIKKLLPVSEGKIEKNRRLFSYA